MRIGVVGGGFIAQAVHLPLLRELPELFSVRAIAEPSRRVREALAARYGIPAAHAEHRALLAAGELDAVLVCAPDALHEPVALDALDAGLHVLVEKPLCLSEAGALRIGDRAEATGRVVQVGYMKRFAPAYEALLDGLGRSARQLVHVSTLTVRPAARRALRAARAPHGHRPARGGRGPRARGDRPPGRRGHGQRGPRARARVLRRVRGRADPRHQRRPRQPRRARRGRGRGRGGRTPSATDEAELAGGTVVLPGGARWSMAWMLIEGAGAFSEELRLHSRDGVRTLRFPAPYLRSAPATLEHVRADGPRGVCAISSGGAVDVYERQLRHFHACVTRGRAVPHAARAGRARSRARRRAVPGVARTRPRAAPRREHGVSGPVIVTGSDSGIGRATAVALAAAGHDVGVTWHTDRDGAEATAAAVRAQGAACAVARLDLADEPGTVVRELAGALGGLWGLVNCAGANHRAALLDDAAEAWRRSLEITLTGPVLCAQAAARILVAAGRGGRIVNVTSIHEHAPLPRASAYSAGKAGLGMATQVLALELAPHAVTVNAVAPGHIATPMTGKAGVDVSSVSLPADPARPTRRARGGRGGRSRTSSRPPRAIVTGASLSVDGGLRLAAAVALQRAVEGDG